MCTGKLFEFDMARALLQRMFPESLLSRERRS